MAAERFKYDSNGNRKAQPKKSARLKKAFSKSILVVVATAVLFVLILLIPIFTTLRKNEAEKKELNQYQESLAAETLRNQQLKALLEREDLTDEEKIEIAREKFGLTFSDEIVFLPKDNE